MFKFLKEKLKKAISIFSKKVEEEADIKEQVKEEVAEEKIPEPALEPEKQIEEPPAEEESHKEMPESEEPEKEPEVAGDKKTEKSIDIEIKEIQEEFERELEEDSRKKSPQEIEEEIKEIKEEFEKKLEDVSEEPEAVKEDIEADIKKIIEFETDEQEKESEDEAKARPVATEESINQDLQELKQIQQGLQQEEEGIRPVEKEKPKTSFFKKLFWKKEEEKEILPKKEKLKKPVEPAEAEAKKEAPEAPEPAPKPEVEEQVEIREKVEAPQAEEVPGKKGFFKRIKETFTTVKLSDEKFEELFWELEVPLMENNVAVEVIEKIKADLKKDLTTGKVSRKGVDELIEDSLRESVQSLFIDKHLNLVNEIRKKKDKPYIIAFIGVNGSGKTTTMAKLAYHLMKHNLSVVFAASDTFRAAAIQQLQEHADRLGVKMIRHDYESDPTAVAFDAVKHAKAKGIDVVMIDTAGRLHVNDNLMNELKKLVRVNKPDMKIFVGESITGNDCVEQAKIFNEAVGIDAIILAKADVDEKGGAAVSVSYVTKKPIIYLGTGQKYEDLQEFRPEVIIKSIGL